MVGQHHQHAVVAEIVKLAPHHATEQQALRGIVEHDLHRPASVIQQKGHRATYRHRKLVEMTVRVPTTMHIVLRGENVVHALDRERHVRSEERTSELQSLMRISDAVLRLKKTNRKQ